MLRGERQFLNDFDEELIFISNVIPRVTREMLDLIRYINENIGDPQFIDNYRYNSGDIDFLNEIQEFNEDIYRIQSLLSQIPQEYPVYQEVSDDLRNVINIYNQLVDSLSILDGHWETKTSEVPELKWEYPGTLEERMRNRDYRQM
jgi:hypothetical protein